MEQEKFNWKRLLITIVIVLVTAGAVGGAVWYVMDMQAKEDKNSLEQRINALEEVKKTEVKEKDEAENWKTYTDKKNLYSIKYPKEWEYDDTYFVGEDFGLVAFGKSAADFPAKQSDQISAITITTGKGESILSYYKESEKVNIENVKIGDTSGTRVTLLPGRENDMYGDSKMVQYELKTAKYGYITILQFQDYEADTFQKMLATLKLL